MHRAALVLVTVALLLTACVGADHRRAATTTSTDTTLVSPADVSGTEPGEPVGTPDTITATDLCVRAEADAAPATVADPDLTEISGVAPSRAHTGVLWVHNDSGSPAELYALGPDGGVVARLDVPDTEAVDWEDIALGRGASPETDALFIGDIGDNTDEPVRDEPPVVIRVDEPDPFLADGTTGPPTRIPFAYADGPRDAEALLADPLTGEVVIVSKQWDGSVAGAYVLPADVALADEGPSVELTLPRATDVGGTEGAPVTGGDVSADGRIVALRTYTDVLLWDRDPTASLAATLAGAPTCSRVVAEPQGEAVGFGPDGRGFVTISEGLNQPIQWHRMLG